MLHNHVLYCHPVVLWEINRCCCWTAIIVLVGVAQQVRGGVGVNTATLDEGRGRRSQASCHRIQCTLGSCRGKSSLFILGADV